MTKGEQGGPKGTMDQGDTKGVPRGCQGVPKDDQGGQMYTRRCCRDGLQVQPRRSRDGPQTLHAERAGRAASRPASQPRNNPQSLPRRFRRATPAAAPEMLPMGRTRGAPQDAPAVAPRDAPAALPENASQNHQNQRRKTSKTPLKTIRSLVPRAAKQNVKSN